MKKFFLLPLLFSLLCFGQSIDNSQLDSFLKKHVSDEGVVNYEKVIKNEEEINAIIAGLAKITPNGSWSDNEAKAYWLNLYNVSIIKLISKHYPLKSINYITDPFKLKYININGEMISLEMIVNDYVKKFKDPRMHFGIHTSANSSPRLRKVAFTSEGLDKELNACAVEFINDTGKNFFSKTKDEVSLSGLLEEMVTEFSSKEEFVSFINKYSNSKTLSIDTPISFLTFDWTLCTSKQ